MNKILSELYHGNYSALDAPYDKNADYAKAMSRATALEEALRTALPTELKTQFEEYVNANAAVLMAYGEKDFAEGVRLGARLMLAVLPAWNEIGGDGNEEE